MASNFVFPMPEQSAASDTPAAPVAHDLPPRPQRVRPQSVLAQNFSSSLDNIFHLRDDNDIVSITNDIDRKRQSVSMQTRELKALEARLRELNERLRSTGVDVPPFESPFIEFGESRLPLSEIDDLIFSAPSSATTYSKRENETASAGSVSSATSEQLPALDPEQDSVPEDADSDASPQEDEEDQPVFKRPPKSRKRSVIIAARAAQARWAAEAMRAAQESKNIITEEWDVRI